MALVQTAVAHAGCLQIGGGARGIAPLQHGSQQPAAESASLLVGGHADELQTEAGLLGVVLMQRLQKETIAAAREVFDREVLRPGLEGAEGLGRLKSLCEAYLSYLERGVFPGGCFFAHTLAELDAPSGALHDEVAADHRGWFSLLEGLAGTARRRGELAPDTDPAQLAFELYAAMELSNYLATLYREPEVIQRGRRAIQTAIAVAQGGARS